MISVKQNESRQLERLAAQRNLYAIAKRILVVQIILSGPVAVASALISRAFPSWEATVALWGFLILFADVLWLEPWLDRRRRDAARIQEAFDCDVLELRWNDIKAGSRPDPELIKEQSDCYNSRAHRMPTLRDWYPTEAAALPIYLARLVCQRANCSWDARLRRRYASFVLAALVIVIVLILVLSFEHNYRLQDFLLKVLAPLAPALGLAYRQFTEQSETATRQEELKAHCASVWESALSGDDQQVISERSRHLQDEIFDSRQESPLVFDFVFALLRQSYQGQMDYSASEMVSEARRRMPGA
ncbi:MAG: S-4TM family putative pore-forming effector [Kiritimatiellae bacterium]|nr:S-4TM family putative pore-forming effector [Kiritimatiellia bacterium]